MGAPETSNELTGALKPSESTSDTNIPDTSGSTNTISQSQTKETNRPTVNVNSLNISVTSTSNSDQESSTHPEKTQPPSSNGSNLTTSADSQSNGAEKNVDSPSVAKLSVKFKDMSLKSSTARNPTSSYQYVDEVVPVLFDPRINLMIERLSIEINPKTGKRMDLWSSRDFTAPTDDKLRPTNHYLREGRRLTYTADNMEEPCEIAIGSLYLKAAMCFLMGGYALDKQNNLHLALRLYIQILIQLKELIGLYDTLSKQGPYRTINRVLHILSLQTLGVLNFQLYNANKVTVHEIYQLQKKHEHEFKKRIKPSNLVWSNISLDVDLQNFEVANIGSVPGYDSESTVSCLTDIPETVQEMTQTTDYLLDANRVWEYSLDLIYAAEIENFFDEVYSKSTDLSKIIDVNCSMLEFVNYVNSAIFLLHERKWFEVLYEHEDPLT